MLPGRNQMWLLFLMLMLVLTPINGLLRVRARKRNHERSTGAVILASVWTALLVVLNLYLIAINGSGVGRSGFSERGRHFHGARCRRGARSRYQRGRRAREGLVDRCSAAPRPSSGARGSLAES